MLNIFKKKEEKVFTDEELFSSLKQDGIQLTEDQIQKAKNDDGNTLCNIGFTYDSNKNYFKALAWYLKSAAQNNSYAQTNIGALYHYGRGVPQDYKQAMDWYLKAANNDGHSMAQYGIGSLYHHGHGVPKDYKQAMNWYLKAVDKDGNQMAQLDIGYLYQMGLGVPKNIHTAIDWYTKAADQGQVNAQYNLARSYEFENEINDLQKATNWFKKAADNGHEKAKKALKSLNQQGYYPKEEVKEENTKTEEAQMTDRIYSIHLKHEGKDIAVHSSGEKEQPSVTIQNDEHIGKLMVEKMKKLEEASQRKLDLLQQDKTDRDALQQRLALFEQKLAETVTEKKERDNEIKQLRAALAQARAATEDDPNNDIYYDSSDQNSDNEDENSKM